MHVFTTSIQIHKRLVFKYPVASNIMLSEHEGEDLFSACDWWHVHISSVTKGLESKKHSPCMEKPSPF